MAFCRARFAAGSGPPSRAATISARESFEKSWPRFLSAAPFLCLIELHLLCPDMTLLLHQLEEPLVHARVVGQLRVERRDEQAALAEEHRLAVELGQHLDLRTALDDARRADEHPAQRPLLAGELKIRLEARDLAAVRVAGDLDVEETEVLAVEQDHPGTGSEHRPGESADRVLEPVEPDEAHDRGRLAAGDHEPVELLELLRLAHLDRFRAEVPEHGRVLAEVALHRQDADSRGFAHALDSSPGAIHTGSSDVQSAYAREKRGSAAHSTHSGPADENRRPPDLLALRSRRRGRASPPRRRDSRAQCRKAGARR